MKKMFPAHPSLSRDGRAVRYSNKSRVKYNDKMGTTFRDQTEFWGEAAVLFLDAIQRG